MHSASSLPVLRQPICMIPLGTWVPKIGESNVRPFAMLRPNASLGDALSLLVQGNSNRERTPELQNYISRSLSS